MTQPIAEMKFAREEADETVSVSSYPGGTVGLYVESTGSIYDAPGEHRLTLGQAIQLRDFLNRHIDELALKQTGSLAERSTDDPAQLASVEEVRVGACGRSFEYAGRSLICGEVANSSPDRLQNRVQCEECLAAIEEAMNRPPAWNEAETKVPFNPDRYKKD